MVFIAKWTRFISVQTAIHVQYRHALQVDQHPNATLQLKDKSITVFLKHEHELSVWDRESNRIGMNDQGKYIILNKHKKMDYNNTGSL